MNADPGVAAERTRLAWRRTALSAAVVSLLAARPAVAPDASTARFVAAGVAVVAGTVLALVAGRRAHRLQGDPPRPAIRDVPAAAGLAVVLACTAALAVLG